MRNNISRNKKKFFILIFVILFLGTNILSYQNVLSTKQTFFILSVLFFVAYFVLEKKWYFLSNLVSSNAKDEEFQNQLGKFSGIVCLLISVILLVLAFLI